MLAIGKSSSSSSVGGSYSSDRSASKKRKTNRGLSTAARVVTNPHERVHPPKSHNSPQIQAFQGFQVRSVGGSDEEALIVSEMDERQKLLVLNVMMLKMRSCLKEGRYEEVSQHFEGVEMLIPNELEAGEELLAIKSECLLLHLMAEASYYPEDTALLESVLSKLESFDKKYRLYGYYRVAIGVNFQLKRYYEALSIINELLINLGSEEFKRQLKVEKLRIKLKLNPDLEAVEKLMTEAEPEFGDYGFYHFVACESYWELRQLDKAEKHLIMAKEKITDIGWRNRRDLEKFEGYINMLNAWVEAEEAEEEPEEGVIASKFPEAPNNNPEDPTESVSYIWQKSIFSLTK